MIGQGELCYCINTFVINYDRWVNFRFSLKPHLLVTLITNIRMGSYIKPIYLCICINQENKQKHKGAKPYMHTHIPTKVI